MATTTNYGWTTPDDTALVKDGAAAIRTLGSSVDTTTKNLNPSTTLGDIEYRSSTANTNTRLGIGSSGQALTVVAGVPSWAASATSVLTTTGDVLYASAANTLARLGIGSSGNVLTVSGGVPVWAAPAAGGKVLQVVVGRTTTQASSSSSSYADTNLTATITPSATTSKILVLISQNGLVKSAASANNRIAIRLNRGATALDNFVADGLDTGTALLNSGSASYSYLDSPATVSATTYKTQFISNAGTATVYCQYSSSQYSSITLIEIGA